MKHTAAATDCCTSCMCSQKLDMASFGSWKKLTLAAVLFAAALVCPKILWIKLPLYLASYLLSGGEVLLKSARHIAAGKVFDENFLMTLATFGAFAIGEYSEAAAVMLFYQTGEMLQETAAGKSRRSIVKLMDLRPDFARVRRNGKEEKINPRNVQIGKNYENSAVAKILELAENAAQKKSSAEKFITRFARIYTPAVVLIAAITAILPPLILPEGSFKIWFYRALIFLVISCPCALVLSVPLGFFGGIGGAAKNGILIKGGSYLERLAHIYTLALDKTGTLTQGVFEVLSILPAAGISRQEVLTLAACAERRSNHPIAKAVLQAAPSVIPIATLPEETRELAGEGIEFKQGNRVILAGNIRLMERFKVGGISPGIDGATCVYIAENGIYKGRIELGDKPKPGALQAIKELKKLVRHLVMLSGDNPAAAEKTARELGISRVYGGLLPADKVAKLEELIKNAPAKAVTAFAGDGINDAPVLARADLALAMGALGSDAAIEAADVVLMTDDLQKIIFAIRISRQTLRVVRQNILFALAVKAAVLLLGVMGLANMWAAVFADVGVSLLAVANSLRPLYFKEK